MSEFSTKQDKIQALLAEKELDALLLRNVSSFAWATCGAASYVNTAATGGAAALLITAGGRYVISNNIEATRLEQEEGLKDQGWEFRVGPWHEAERFVAALSHGLRLGSDSPHDGAVDVSAEMIQLRVNLMPQEDERFRALAQLCAGAMDEAIRAVRPGQSEYEIAGKLARAAESRGAQAIVNLIASDERIYAFRHPLPTAKKLDRYAMLVLCGRRWGLVCSLTRLVHFGPLPGELRRRAEATARIDAALIAATRPGKSLAQVFQQGMAAYSAAGFADEWHLHHQGGPAGYEPREIIATPSSPELVSVGQVYAWNPSITGTKSEDSVLVGEDENQILTEMEGWPVLKVAVAGREFKRPAILEVT
jgi:Xaa-Pro aminopeptidase